MPIGTVGYGNNTHVLIKKQSEKISVAQPKFSGRFNQSLGAAVLGMLPWFFPSGSLLAQQPIPATVSENESGLPKTFAQMDEYRVFLANIRKDLQTDLKAEASSFPWPKYEALLTRNAPEGMSYWTVLTPPDQGMDVVRFQEDLVPQFKAHPYVDFLDQLATRARAEKANRLLPLIEKQLVAIILRNESLGQLIPVKVTASQVLNRHFGQPTPLGTREYPLTLEQKLRIAVASDSFQVPSIFYTMPHQRQEFQKWLVNQMAAQPLEDILLEKESTYVGRPAQGLNIPLLQVVESYCQGLARWRGSEGIQEDFKSLAMPRDMLTALTQATEKLLAAHQGKDDAQAKKHMTTLQQILSFSAKHSHIPDNLLFTNEVKGKVQFLAEQERALPTLMSMLYENPSEALLELVKTVLDYTLGTPRSETMVQGYLQQMNARTAAVIEELTRFSSKTTLDEVTAFQKGPVYQRFQKLSSLSHNFMSRAQMVQPPAAFQKEIQGANAHTKTLLNMFTTISANVHPAILKLLYERGPMTQLSARDALTFLRRSPTPNDGSDKWVLQQLVPNEVVALQEPWLDDINQIVEDFITAEEKQDKPQAEALFNRYKYYMSFASALDWTKVLREPEPVFKPLVEKWRQSSSRMIGLLATQAQQGAISPELKDMLHARHYYLGLDREDLLDVLLDKRMMQPEAFDFVREHIGPVAFPAAAQQRYLVAIQETTEIFLEAAQQNHPGEQEKALNRLALLMQLKDPVLDNFWISDPESQKLPAVKIWYEQQKALEAVLQAQLRQGKPTIPLVQLLIQRSSSEPKNAAALTQSFIDMMATNPKNMAWLDLFAQTHEFMFQHIKQQLANSDAAIISAGEEIKVADHDPFRESLTQLFIATLDHVMAQPPSPANQKQIQDILLHSATLTQPFLAETRPLEHWQAKALEQLLQHPDRNHFEATAKTFAVCRTSWHTFGDLAQLDRFMRKVSPQFEVLVKHWGNQLLTGTEKEKQAAAEMLMNLPRLSPKANVELGNPLVGEEMGAFVQRILCSGTRDIPGLAEKLSHHPEWLSFERPEDIRLRTRVLTTWMSWQGQLAVGQPYPMASLREYRTALYGPIDFVPEARARYLKLESLLPPMLKIALERGKTDAAWRSVAVEAMGDVVRLFPERFSTDRQTAREFPVQARVAYLRPWIQSVLQQLEANPDSLTATEAATLPRLLRWDEESELSRQYRTLVKSMLSRSQRLDQSTLTQLLAGLGQLRPTPETVNLIFETMRQPLPMDIAREGPGQAMKSWFLHDWLVSTPQQQDAFARRFQRADARGVPAAHVVTSSPHTPVSPRDVTLTPTQETILRLVELSRMGPEASKLQGNRLLGAEANLAVSLSWGDFPPSTGSSWYSVEGLPNHVIQKLPPHLSPEKIKNAETHMTQAFYKTFNPKDTAAMARYNQAFQEAQATFRHLTRFLIENLDPVYTQDLSPEFRARLTEALERLTADNSNNSASPAWAIAVIKQLGDHMIRIQDAEATRIKGQAREMLFPLMQSLNRLEHRSEDLMFQTDPWARGSIEIPLHLQYTRRFLRQSNLPQDVAEEWLPDDTPTGTVEGAINPETYFKRAENKMNATIERLLSLKTTGSQDLSRAVLHPHMRFRSMTDFIQHLSQRILLMQSVHEDTEAHEHLENAFYTEVRNRIEPWLNSTEANKNRLWTEFINTFLETPALGSTPISDRNEMLQKMGVSSAARSYHTSDFAKEALQKSRQHSP